MVCASAGRAIAARSEPVCLVDAHGDNERMTQLLGSDARTVTVTEAFSAHERATNPGGQVWVAGKQMVRDVDGMLRPAAELRVKLSRLQSLYGTVLIDAPALSSNRDAALLGQLADGVVLVIEANSTRKIAARKAKEFLERSGVQLIGAILNNRTFPIPELLYKRL